jgi:hypothetical protein
MGSLIGAASSLTTTWFTQRNQQRAQWRVQEATTREALYAEFIKEASRCLVDAVTHETGQPEMLLGLVGTLGRMRLKSSPPVIEAGENLLRLVVNSYAAPNLTFDDIRVLMERGEDSDPLADFGEACRAELEILRAP